MIMNTLIQWLKCEKIKMAAFPPVFGCILRSCEVDFRTLFWFVLSASIIFLQLLKCQKNKKWQHSPCICMFLKVVGGPFSHSFWVCTVSFNHTSTVTKMLKKQKWQHFPLYFNVFLGFCVVDFALYCGFGLASFSYSLAYVCSTSQSFFATFTAFWNVCFTRFD